MQPNFLSLLTVSLSVSVLVHSELTILTWLSSYSGPLGEMLHGGLFSFTWG